MAKKLPGNIQSQDNKGVRYQEKNTVNQEIWFSASYYFELQGVVKTIKWLKLPLIMNTYFKKSD